MSKNLYKLILRLINKNKFDSNNKNNKFINNNITSNDSDDENDKITNDIRKINNSNEEINKISMGFIEFQ